jgi:hypothetical protein
MGMNKNKLKERNKAASSIVAEATGEIQAEDKPIKNNANVEPGRLGGLKGGKARAEKLTAQQRRKIAIMAAHARWKKR